LFTLYNAKKRDVFQKLLHLEFQLKDVLQVMIGASILSIPVGFTEETWYLGETLPMANIIASANSSAVIMYL